MSDMTHDIFEKYPFGILALRKIGKVPENFRLYDAGLIGSSILNSNNVMKVTGAEFRVAKSGKYKGKLSIKIKGTEMTVYLTADEIKAFDTEQCNHDRRG